MNARDREACERLHSALQGEADSMLDEAHSEAAVLTGWIVVCEWMDENGEKFLSRYQMPALPGWQIRGFLHEALFNWPTPSENGDEE